jgi:hypothetical protein
MTHRFQGLYQTAQVSTDDLPDGLYLVRVERAQYRWHRQKPFYVIRFSVLEPQKLLGRTITGRLDCTAKTLWKLGWLLSDFGYDPDLLRRDEVDEKAMLGLRGVVKVSMKTKVAHVAGSESSLVHFDGFAPADQWPMLRSRAAEVRVSSLEATQ